MFLAPFALTCVHRPSMFSHFPSRIPQCMFEHGWLEIPVKTHFLSRIVFLCCSILMETFKDVTSTYFFPHRVTRLQNTLSKLSNPHLNTNETRLRNSQRFVELSKNWQIDRDEFQVSFILLSISYDVGISINNF